MEVMTTFDVIVLVLGMLGFGGIVSGTVTIIIRRNFERMDAKTEKRAESRIMETMLMMKGIRAIGHLAEATACAQIEGKCNGKMTKAMECYDKYRSEEDDFHSKVSATSMHVCD